VPIRPWIGAPTPAWLKICFARDSRDGQGAMISYSPLSFRLQRTLILALLILLLLLELLAGGAWDPRKAGRPAALARGRIGGVGLLACSLTFEHNSLDVHGPSAADPNIAGWAGRPGRRDREAIRARPLSGRRLRFEERKSA